MRWVWVLVCLVAAMRPVAAQDVCFAKIDLVGPPINPCLDEERVKISAVGDVLLHRPLQRRGYSDDDGFYSIWSDAATLFHMADIAYANLEGPVAPGIAKGGRIVSDPGPEFDDRVYSSFPLFNYHPRVISDLKRAGITVVSTANNHALDRGALGVDRTIDELRATNMLFTGTIKASAVRTFATYTQSRLGRIAWIACSYSTNGLADPNSQMLMCFEDREELLHLVAQAVSHPRTAAVIVTPHWGVEYSHRPNDRQKALAADLMQAGATAVIGTHPHVVQPWDLLPTSGGAKGLAIYSTGNFVSGQFSLARRVGAIAWVELCRPPTRPDLAKALQSNLVVAAAGWVPVQMNRTAAGPKLSIADRTGVEAKRLLERHLPENGITARVECHALDATLLPLQ